MRTRAALVAAATVSGLLVTPTSAAGVEPTCQGRPATIVASSKPGAVTNGTEGDDVIVGTSANIYALGGDDLVCLRNGAVASGDGDDTVLATGTAASGVSAYLGPGDDRYIGSPGSDYVRLADVAPDDHPVLDLGAGKDSLVMELHAGSSVQVQAGEGADDLVLTGDSSDYVFDLGTGEVTRAGVEVASLLGFENHDLSFGGTSGLRLLGTPGPDSLALEAGRLDLHLGDGSDSLYLDWGSSRIPEAGAIDLGGGEDSLETVKAHLFVADLARGSLKLGAGGGHSGNLSLLGVERLRTVGSGWCCVVDPGQTCWPPSAATSACAEGLDPTIWQDAPPAYQDVARTSLAAQVTIALWEASRPICWWGVPARTKRWVAVARTPAAPNARRPANDRRIAYPSRSSTTISATQAGLASPSISIT